MAEYIALCAKRQCQRWQAPFSRRACLCQRRRSRGQDATYFNIEVNKKS